MVASSLRARNIGTEAAVIVMAACAAARMTSIVVDSVIVDCEMDASCVILTIDAIPALPLC